MQAPRQRRRSSLRTCLIIAVSCLLLLTIVLSYFTTMVVLKKERIAEAQQHLQQIVTYQQLLIDGWLDERVHDLNILALSIRTQIQSKTVGDYLLSFLQIHPEYNHLYIVKPTGGIAFSTGGDVGKDLSQRPYFRQARAGNGRVSDLFYSSYAERNVIVITAPIWDAAGELMGLIVGVLNENAMNWVMQTFELGETGQAYLLNRNGLLVTQPQSVFTSMDGEKLSELLQHALQAEFFPSAYRNSWDHDVFGAYAWTNEGRWLLVAEMDQAEVLQPFYRVRQNLSITIAFVMLLAFFYILHFSRQIQSPLLSLVEGARRIQAGEYGYQVELDHKSHGTKEIADLTMVFNRMSQKVATTIQLLQKRERQLKLLSNTDGLTGVANRRYFNLWYEKQWKQARLKNELLSVILIDIDFFKKYNDTYGHLAGDHVLQQVAATIAETVEQQTEGLVARYGGEEFVVVLPPKAGSAEARAVAEQIRNNVEALQIEHRTSTVLPVLTISLGVASAIPAQGEHAGTLLAMADRRLYQAKQGGRNQVSFGK